MALLDTTVLIDLGRGTRSPVRLRAMALMDRLLDEDDTLYTSRLNEAEFRVGSFRADDPGRETETIETVLAATVILEFDVASAARYAQVRARLLDLGKPAGEIDTLVAAVAMENGQALVTRNPKHFANITGLTVLTY